MRRRFLRPAVAGAVLVLVGLAVAVAVVMTSSSTSARGQHGLAFTKGDPDAVAEAKNSETAVGPNESRTPENTAEAQDAEWRAYPAADIPFSATTNAVQAWNKLKAGKNTPGQWTLAGPSIANYPSVLTFSGASYSASGRVTGLAIDPSCATGGKCRAWAAAAGGGIWRTDNALSGSGANWTFVSDSFATNAIGTLVYIGGVLYAGTGESHASGDSEAGLGIYKSTDGGTTWTHLASQVTALTTTSCGASNAAGVCVLPVSNGTYTGDAFAGRAISSIVVDPTNANHLWVSSTRGVRGISSVTGGTTSNPPIPRPPFGLFESTDGGATFSYIWSGNDSVRGVNRVVLDPGYNGTTNKTIYAAAYQQGVWRSTNGGGSFSQIKPAYQPFFNTDRAEFAVTTAAGSTRMYVGDGNQSDTDAVTPTSCPPGNCRAHFFRSDDVQAASPVFADMTNDRNIGYCTAQCWYDNVVYSPPGKPDVVYLGGSYSYGTYGFSTNGRAFIRSANAGATWTDQTWDATTSPKPADNCCQPNAIAPNGMHPDSHAIVEIPGTNAAIYGGDGGLMRSSGDFADISSQCDSRPLGPVSMSRCHELLSAVPTFLYNLNKGLSTLQFQSLSVAADNPKHLQGGTQDNGTFETYGSAVAWPQIIYGDGGQSGFNLGNSSIRFNSFFGNFHDANFQNGDPTKWVIISGPIASSEGSNFYAPIIADPHPANAGTIFEGSFSVWRTQDWGGSQAYLEANCPEFTTSGTNPACGDFVRIGPAGATNLTAASYGTRAGGAVAATERTASDTGTLWAATNTGRVFISKNADAAAGSVTWTRLDTLPSATADPGRFVSSIYVDPANANHAWISYSGYTFNTPSQPGHIFSVTYNGSTDATWTSLDGTGATAFPDFPATDLVRDSNGDLYASNDFGVLRLPSGSSDWEVAGTGLPKAEVPGLTIVPSARKLYAATHGRSAWQLTLP